MGSGPAENRGIDEKLFDMLCDVWQKSPSLQTLAMNLSFLAPGRAGMEMAASPAYATVRGRLHGGIIATMLDTAMGWAVLSQGYNCVTTDIHTNYLAEVFEGDRLTAEGVVLHLGRRSAVAEATLRDGKGRLMAASRATFAIRKMRSLDDR